MTVSTKQKDPLFHGRVNRLGEFLFAYVPEQVKAAPKPSKQRYSAENAKFDG